MKRNLLSLLLLFGLSVTCKLSNAQQFRINWQEEQKIENQLINLFPTSDGGCVKVCYLPGKGNTVSPAMIKSEVFTNSTFFVFFYRQCYKQGYNTRQKDGYYDA